MKSQLIIIAALVSASLLAGCTVDTPPIEVRGPDRLRVDAEPVQARVDAEGDDRAELALDTTAPDGNQNVNNINIEVNAEATSAQPAVLLVVVRDEDTGEVIDNRTVTVQDQQTTNFNVNVEGKDNVVVITQAIDGAANVNVAAHQATAIQEDVEVEERDQVIVDDRDRARIDDRDRFEQERERERDRDRADADRDIRIRLGDDRRGEDGRDGRDGFRAGGDTRTTTDTGTTGGADMGGDGGRDGGGATGAGETRTTTTTGGGGAAA